MKKVLVVDDTKNIRLLLSKCLELEGYEVQTANDGQQAIELFKNDHFDLAFLDIKMPEIRGTEVLKRIREMGIDTPVIIITAYATIKNAVDCTKMGAVAYLQKPFTTDKIKSVLNDLCFCPQEAEPKGLKNTLESAKSLIDRKSYTKALDLLKSIISVELDNAEVYLLISKAYEGLDDREKAEKFYRTFQLFS